jgi:hypothetical protein
MMDALNMFKERLKFLGELNIVSDLISTKTQLTTRNGICLVLIRFDIIEHVKYVRTSCNSICTTNG